MKFALPLAHWHLHYAHGSQLAVVRGDAAFLPGGFREAEIFGDRAMAIKLLREALPRNQVAALLAQVMSNRQIAARLVLSERTVESHVRSILAKTQCAKRTEFVAKWNARRDRPRARPRHQGPSGTSAAV